MEVTVNSILRSDCQNCKKSLFKSNAINEIHFPVGLCSVSPPLPAWSPSPCQGRRGQLGSRKTSGCSRRLGAPLCHGCGCEGSWCLLTPGSICSSLHMPVSAEAPIMPYTSLSNWFVCKRLLILVTKSLFSFFLKIAFPYVFNFVRHLVL